MTKLANTQWRMLRGDKKLSAPSLPFPIQNIGTALAKGELGSEELSQAYRQIKITANPELICAFENTVRVLHAEALANLSGYGFNHRRNVGHAVYEMLFSGDTVGFDRILDGAPCRDPLSETLRGQIENLKNQIERHLQNRGMHVHSTYKPSETMLPRTAATLRRFAA